MPARQEYDRDPEHYREYNRQYLRKWRSRTKWEGERATKGNARTAVAYAIRTGKLQREACEVVDCLEIGEAHHDDYSKALEVRWLCKTHHEAVHHK